MQPAPRRSSDELDKFMERYRAAMRAYNVATATLEQLTGADFEAACQRAEQTRLTYEAARSELYRHLAPSRRSSHLIESP